MKTYKKDQRGITHNLMLAGIAVLVLGAIGFAGFRVYKSKNDISAKAAGYTEQSLPGNSTAYLCQTYIDSLRKYRVKSNVYFGTANSSYSYIVISDVGKRYGQFDVTGKTAGTKSAYKYLYTTGLAYTMDRVKIATC
jgi:hypothetical protein